jgi:hypothetical protein
MKWVRISLFVLLGALGYYFHSALQDFAKGLSTNFLRETKREKEVHKVFANYTELISHGDPRSENVYLPNAVVRMASADAHGHLRQITETGTDHRAVSLVILPRLRSSQARVRFEDVLCRELPDHKVRVTFAAYVNDGPADQVSMLFVNTAPQRWAVAEEVHGTP